MTRGRQSSDPTNVNDDPARLSIRINLCMQYNGSCGGAFERSVTQCRVIRRILTQGV